MGRLKRHFVPGEAYFVLLEGKPDNISFADDACFRFYLTRLLNCLNYYDIRLHAYALLPNEVQLLLTPLTPTGVSGLMKAIGGSYAQYYNNRFETSGSLWKGRFKSSQVDTGRTFLNCQKFIELAPIRLNLVEHPGEYPWSSYCTNAFGGHGKFLSSHISYRDLAPRPVERYQIYRQLVARSFAGPYFDALNGRLRSGCARVP